MQLAAGRSVLMFPEGTRSPDGSLQEFKSGAGYLALRSGCDVLPIHISGTHQVLGKGNLIPHHHFVEVRIGGVISNQRLREIAENAAAREPIVRSRISCAHGRRPAVGAPQDVQGAPGTKGARDGKASPSRTRPRPPDLSGKVRNGRFYRRETCIVPSLTFRETVGFQMRSLISSVGRSLPAIRFGLK